MLYAICCMLPCHMTCQHDAAAACTALCCTILNKLWDRVLSDATWLVAGGKPGMGAMMMTQEVTAIKHHDEVVLGWACTHGWGH